MNEAKKNSVLIVDDTIENIKLLSFILKDEYTVYAAKCGQEAIEAAEKFLPDVILLDILMPQMDGYEVLAKLKNTERTANIPVIFATALSQAADEERGLLLGAVDYITKPFSTAIVKLRVKRQIDIIGQHIALIEKEREAMNNRANMELFASMVHEMLASVHVITGAVQGLKMPDMLEDRINTIDAASRSLLERIHSLLDLSGKK